MNEGAEERLVATTDPEDESITFSSSDPKVATVTLTGLVSALSSGTTTITATVTSSGNTATCTVTVNEQSVSIPTGNDIIRIDKNQDFERVVAESVSDLTISRSNDITTLTYTPEIVLKNDWSNQVSLSLKGTDLTRSTKVCFNFKGNGEDVFMLVYDETTTTILQQTFKTTAGWNTYEANIPKATRHLMEKAEKVCLTVPVPSAKYKGNGGTVKIGGLWFAGDAEPSVLKTYDYKNYAVLASLDLSKWNSATFKDTFQGNNKVENGSTYIEGTYNEEDGSLTLVNKGYGKWISFPMSVPSGDFKDAECIAIKAKGTAGAMIAGQVQWKEAYEMKGFTSEVKYHFADISEYPISEKGGYVSFAPCKFNSGYNEWELTIYSIEILRPLRDGEKPAVQPEASADIPDGVVRLDENQSFVKNPKYKGGMSINKDETVTEIWLQSAGIREGKGGNFVTLSLKNYPVSGATDLCFRIKGKGDKVVVNLKTADGTEILSEKVRTFVTWSLYKLIIPEDKRGLLDDTAILSFTVPEYNPNYKVQGGCYVWFDGVWFNGGAVTETNEFTVTFNSDGGSDVAAATVAEGGKVTKPADPTKDGFTFGGWYKESACTNAWNFETDTVTADVTLYAKWAEGTETPDPVVPAGSVRIDTSENGFVANPDKKTYISVVKSSDGNATTITVKGQALKVSDESNYVALSIAAVDATDATKITLNVKGYWFKEVNKENVVQNGTVIITVKLLTAAGETILSQDVTLKENGEVVEIIIPEDKKTLLATAESITFVVPKYESDPAQGLRVNVEFSGVWIDGVAKTTQPDDSAEQ